MTDTPKNTEALVRGVSPVLEVPFRDNGDLDPEGFTTVVDRVLATGVSSVMFPGFASEFHKLDYGERELLTGMLLDRTREEPGVAAIVSVPDHATRHAVAQAEWAAERGADALNVLPPHFLGPSREAVLTHVRAVLAAVDPLPVVVQYAPAQTGTALDAPTLHQLAAEHANLRWVKVESAPPGGSSRLSRRGRGHCRRWWATRDSSCPTHCGAARSACSPGVPSPSCTSSCGAAGRRATRTAASPYIPG